MARLKIGFNTSDSIEIKGSGQFVNRVLGYITPILQATALAVDIITPEVMREAAEEMKQAMAAADRGEDFEGKYWKHTLEPKEKSAKRKK
jgi:hypothetical protein